MSTPVDRDLGSCSTLRNGCATNAVSKNVLRKFRNLFPVLISTPPARGTPERGGRRRATLARAEPDARRSAGTPTAQSRHDCLFFARHRRSRDRGPIRRKQVPGGRGDDHRRGTEQRDAFLRSAILGTKVQCCGEPSAAIGSVERQSGISAQSGRSMSTCRDGCRLSCGRERRH